MSQILRIATISRKTSETDINLELAVDGRGVSKISSSVPFLDHLLTSFSRHGLFDLQLQAVGDIEIDFHHTVEDVGIVLGEAFKQALADKKGINRFGSVRVPMDEALAEVTVDLSGRAYLVYNVEISTPLVGSFATELVKEFFQAFANSCGCNLHVNLLYGSNAHHIIEACFKAFGRAMDVATALDSRVSGVVMSTKGVL
jgi:imidazoleglycerol-phosphate dehydratase